MPRNPHVHVPLGTGDLVERLTELSDADLLTYLRWSHWEYRHSDKPPFTRWGHSKLFSSARRELVRRGRDADAWRPPSP